MNAAIITISDGCYYQKRKDTSGQALAQLLIDNEWTINPTKIVPDEIQEIQNQIIGLSENDDIDLIVTTGGTGLGPRDITPEAIKPLLEKEVLGLAELMRLRGFEQTDFAALSRSLAGSRQKTLILALPGSPKGAIESLQAILKLIPHAIDLLQGRTQHNK